MNFNKFFDKNSSEIEIFNFDDDLDQLRKEVCYNFCDKKSREMEGCSLKSAISECMQNILIPLQICDVKSFNLVIKIMSEIGKEA